MCYFNKGCYNSSNPYPLINLSWPSLEINYVDGCSFIKGSYNSEPILQEGAWIEQFEWWIWMCCIDNIFLK